MKTNNYISDKDGFPVVSSTIQLLCGAFASFDITNVISYRCNICNAVVGSIDMPDNCKELYDMKRVVETLKGTK